MTPEHIKNLQADLVDQCREGLPPPGSMVQKAIDLCLDNINKGYEEEHYREVLRKLSEIRIKDHAQKRHS